MPNLPALFRLDNRIALVAGAASGIGRAAAHGLSAAGAITICADINQPAAETVVDEILEAGGKAEPLALDITDESSIARAMHHIQERTRARSRSLSARPRSTCASRYSITPPMNSIA